MRRILFALTAAAAFSQQPPIIDRSLFFEDPEIAGTQLSPDGKYIAFVKPLDKTRNVWVKERGQPFAAARPVTAVTRTPVSGYFWSRDGKYILFVQDDNGDENYNIWAVDPAATPEPGKKAPAARNITAAKKVRALIYHVSKADPDAVFAGLNERDKAWHDLYKVRISTGERTLLRENTGKIAGWVFDDKDQPRLATRVANNGDTEILRVDGDKLETIAKCNVFESCGPIRIHKDLKQAYFSSNAGDADLMSLYLLDLASGKQTLVETDPLKRVDFGAAAFNEAGDLESFSYTDEKRRMYFRDKKVEADFKFLQSKFPGRQVSRNSRTRDEMTWLVAVHSDTEPGEVYLFDRKARTATLQYRFIEKLDRAALSPMTPIEYPSSDGLRIPAYLTLPKGLPAKNLPLIVFPHGGPWARDVWGFNTFHQFLANRGYAVLAPNFRASTGYGKKFLNAGNGEWGAKMQDDITWGVKHLVANGTVDPKRVGIMGFSYGGYATLAGVAFTPDVYSAAVSIVGPSNLKTLLDAIPPYWESGRKMFATRMADPSTPEGIAALRKMSPLHAAGKIKTPLMVVQGANDPRVAQAESDQIVIALRDRNYPVKYLVAPDEGHGFAKPVNNLATFVAVERFFETHLGGRSQKDVPEPVAAKLDQLTVDPKTVKLPVKLDPVKSGAPKAVRSLTPGTYVFEGEMEIGSQRLKMTVTSGIQKTAAGWTIQDKVSFPMAEAEATSTLEEGTLYETSGTMKMGPVAYELRVTGNTLEGKMSLNGQERPLKIDTGGPLFGDGGAPFQVGALPLAEGYQTVLRSFDPQKAKIKLTNLKVTGSETVKVPAGEFEAWKVEMTPQEGQGTSSVWIEKSSGRPLKSVATLPESNGAKISLELK